MIPSPGRLLYLLRKNHREGWTTPYYRDRIRPQILSTPAIETAEVGTAGAVAAGADAVGVSPVEVFILTRNDDLLNLLWSLKSFYHFAGTNYPLTILEDGTLDAAGESLLKGHFPNARLIRSSAADAAMAPQLAAYPRCAQYRASHALARKAFDVGYYNRSPKVLLLDTDLIFLARPSELLQWVESTDKAANVFNADVSPGLNISTAEAWRKFQIDLPDCINSGLALLQREVFNLAWMEEFLGCPDLLRGNIWRVEQTLLALSASRLGAKLLSPSYLVSLQPGLEGCVVKHYVGAVRHLMYREGIARLYQQGFLTALRETHPASPPNRLPA